MVTCRFLTNSAFFPASNNDAGKRGCGRGDFRDTAAGELPPFCRSSTLLPWDDWAESLTPNRPKFALGGVTLKKRALQFADSGRHPVGKCDRRGKEQFLPVINCCRGTHDSFLSDQKKSTESVSRFLSLILSSLSENLKTAFPIRIIVASWYLSPPKPFRQLNNMTVPLLDVRWRNTRSPSGIQCVQRVWGTFCCDYCHVSSICVLFTCGEATQVNGWHLAFRPGRSSHWRQLETSGVW